MAADGVDVSGFQTITGMYSSSDLSARGLSNKPSKWDGRDPVDNKIVIPFSFHKNYPDDFKAAAMTAYENLNKDLGCIKLKYIESDLAKYINGVFIVYEDVSGTGCYSALGKSPGYIGRCNLYPKRQFFITTISLVLGKNLTKDLTCLTSGLIVHFRLRSDFL